MKGKDNVLVVDDEPGICQSVGIVLRGAGYAVETAASGAGALARLAERAFGLAIVDLKLPDVGGLELIEQMKGVDPELAIVVISGHGTIADAVRATQLGAYDFLEKPLHRERMLLSVQRALEHRRLSGLSAVLRRQDEKDEMVGQSQPLQALRQSIELVAPTRGRVLISGESGTGKELVARAIHRQSALTEGPFVKLNCAAIPPTLIESELFGYEKGAFTGADSGARGRFEEAHGGTLFLDEIGDMRLEVQSKLLRVLQEGELRRVGGSRVIHVDVRVIAATNKDLTAEVEAGRFRDDLFFRLNVVPLDVPPLRKRREDIPRLAEHFCERLCQEHGLPQKHLSKGVIERLTQHSWPGNVRELRNVIERVVILSGRKTEIDAMELSGSFSPQNPLPASRGDETLKDYLNRAEREILKRRLDQVQWNVTRAAEALGIERTNLHRKMRQHRLKRPQDVADA